VRKFVLLQSLPYTGEDGLAATDHPDTSPFEFVAGIGADGRVLRLYIDRETNTLIRRAKPFTKLRLEHQFTVEKGQSTTKQNGLLHPRAGSENLVNTGVHNYFAPELVLAVEILRPKMAGSVWQHKMSQNPCWTLIPETFNSKRFGI